MLEKNIESRVHVEEIEEPPAPGQSIAFGLERMGLIAVKAPVLSCLILAALMIAAKHGNLEMLRSLIENNLYTP